nr:vacuolar protein sorting-associated protein 8 homolog isoform X1 [Ipomoea trifida]GME03642.1 vacuolar protein sorting-associated protein 8 homolog isoform X1 [Ipomoea batatas]
MSRSQFGKLGELIASHQRLKEHSRFLFIPSPDDVDTFLELLEPYILKDMLGSLPPEVVFVCSEDYASASGTLQQQREHMLYGALIYLFNKGLGDFKAPLEELFSIIRNSKGETAAPFG